MLPWLWLVNVLLFFPKARLSTTHPDVKWCILPLYLLPLLLASSLLLYFSTSLLLYFSTSLLLSHEHPCACPASAPCASLCVPLRMPLRLPCACPCAAPAHPYVLCTFFPFSSLSSSSSPLLLPRPSLTLPPINLFSFTP